MLYTLECTAIPPSIPRASPKVSCVSMNVSPLNNAASVALSPSSIATSFTMSAELFATLSANTPVSEAINNSCLRLAQYSATSDAIAPIGSSPLNAVAKSLTPHALPLA